MTRRDFVRRSALGAASAGMGTLAMSELSNEAHAQSRTNLVIVFPDQMRGQALGFLGEDPVITPHLDRFASESLVLPQAVSNYPVCSPYRGMLMSGMYPHRNKVTGNCTNRTARDGCELQERDRCWSDVLKDSGYSLGYIGKWHLDSPRAPYVKCTNNRGETKWNEWCAPARRHGFDFWYSYGTYDYHNRPMYWRTDAARDGFHFVDRWGPEHEADLAIEYIRNAGGTYRDPEKPFALVVSMNPPHTPYNLVPKKYVEHYAGRSVDDLCNRPSIPPARDKMGARYRKDIRNYFAMVTGVDEQFGRILAALGEAGLDEDTIVLFTSDHGNCLGAHGQITKNNHYEESMRVPFLVRWPGRIAPRRDDLLVSVPDVYPTLLDMMGLADAVPASVQGTSHARLFLERRGERPRSQLYLKMPSRDPSQGFRGVRTHRYKLVIEHRNEGEPRIVLHDLERDPYELENIAEREPRTVKTLVKTELAPWLRRIGDPWLRNLNAQVHASL